MDDAGGVADVGSGSSGSSQPRVALGVGERPLQLHPKPALMRTHTANVGSNASIPPELRQVVCARV